MRWYRIDTSIKIPRYPSPASEPDESLLYNPEKIELDYKTSYRDSHYNIRYSTPFPNLV